MEKCAMFSFLLDGGSAPSVDLDILKEFAKEASVSFLGANNTPLNQSILKIAQSESLTPDSVDIVCQEANKLVHAGLFKNAEDRYVVFDIANPKHIVESISTPGTEKIASKSFSISSDDYQLGPEESKNSFKDFTITKTASGKHEGLYNMDKFNEKKSLEKRAWDKKCVQEEILIKTAQIENLEKEFIKISRNQLLEVPLRERRDLFPQIAYFTKEAGMDSKYTQKLMGYLDSVLVQQGLIEKTADIKADPSLISDNLNVAVINGTHPLSGIIKTIVKKNNQILGLSDSDENLIKTKMSNSNTDGAILGQVLKAD